MSEQSPVKQRKVLPFREVGSDGLSNMPFLTSEEISAMQTWTDGLLTLMRFNYLRETEEASLDGTQNMVEFYRGRAEHFKRKATLVVQDDPELHPDEVLIELGLHHSGEHRGYHLSHR